MPNHVAITMSGIKGWAQEKNMKGQEAFKISFDNFYKLINCQVKTKTTILSVLVMGEKETEDFLVMADPFLEFLGKIKNSPLVSDNRIKIGFIGKWYDLPGRIVEGIKQVIDATKDNDSFFLNICINYDGHQEIVDATRLIARKVVSGKLDAESINKDRIEESLYASNLLIPEVIVKTGKTRKLGTFLLWDAAYASIIFAKKAWPDITEEDFTSYLNLQE